MRKYTIILALLLLNISVALGQAVRTDSINRLLARTTNDSMRIELLTELAFYYQFYQPDSSIIVLKQAVAKARKVRFMRGEIKALISLGEVYRILGDYPQALELSFRALRMSKAVHDMASEANARAFIGSVYVELNEYRQGISYFKEALKYRDKLTGYYPYRTQYAFVLASTGNAYERLNLLDSAMYFQRQALHLAKNNLVTLTLYYMGILQERLGNTDSALYYYRRSLQNLVAMELLGQGRGAITLSVNVP